MIFDIGALIIICIFWCLLNFWTVSVSRKTFGFCMPVTFMLSTLLMIISGLVFHSFKPAFFVLIISAIAVVVTFANFGIIKFLRRSIVESADGHRDAISELEQNIKKIYFSNGFYAFIALFVFFGVLDFGRHFWAWDEFEHWGVMIKEILRLDDLYNIEQANLCVHKDYPPFSSLFMALWCLLRGRYDEGLVTTAMHVLEFSFVTLPVMDWYKGKRIGIANGIEQFFNSLILLFVMAVFAMSFDTYGTFGTIYPDLLMVLFLVYAATLIMDGDIRETSFGFFAVMLSGVCALLTKQMGICFTLLIWLLYVSVTVANRITAKMVKIEAEKAGTTDLKVIHSGDGFDIVEEKKPQDTITSRRSFIRSVLVLVVPVCIFLLWRYYIQRLDIAGQFETGNIEFGRIFDILRGVGTENELLIARNFLGRLLQTDLCCGFLRLPYIMLNIIYVLAIAAIIYFFGQKNGKQTDKISVVISALPYVITVITGAVGYAFTMQVLYLFCFPGETDGGVLPSFTRYMGTYVTGMLILVLCLLMYKLIKSGRELFSVINILAVTLCMVFLISTEKLGSDIIPQGLIEEKYSLYHEIADNIDKFTEEDDRILIISANGIQDIPFLQYYLNKCRLSWEFTYDDIAMKFDPDSVFWNKIDMREYDHVYVFFPTYSADIRLAEPGGLENFSAGTLYRINPTADGGYRLEFECVGYEFQYDDDQERRNCDRAVNLCFTIPFIMTSIGSVFS